MCAPAHAFRLTPTGDRRVLQDHVPLRDSLEWRLSLSYWEERGFLAFHSGEVPNLSINDGALADDTAALLAETGPESGTVRVLELGAGSGLFAKLFLDSLRRRHPAMHARLEYVCTDGSPRMVRQVEDSGLLESHRTQVRFKTVSCPHLEMDSATRGAGFDLITGNYLLDNLPCDCLFIRDNQVSEMCLQASVDAGLDLPAITGVSEAELQGILADPGALHPALVRLHPHVVFHARYEKRDRATLPRCSTIPLNLPLPTGFYWPHSHGALDCLEHACALLRPRGAFLINDYGYRPLSYGQNFRPQNYGESLAVGLNLDQVEAFGESMPGWQVVKPLHDSQHVMSRWVTRADAPARAGERFRELFDGQRRDRVPDLIGQYQDLRADTQPMEAYARLQEALRVQPHAWSTLERAAEWHLSNDGEGPSRALDFARRGLALNPHSGRLWTLLGDALARSGEAVEAAQAYARASGWNDLDGRPWLGLARLRLAADRMPEALSSLAVGLARDTREPVRAALLAVQTEALQWLDQLRDQRTRRKSRRYRNFRSGRDPEA